MSEGIMPLDLNSIIKVHMRSSDKVLMKMIAMMINICCVLSTILSIISFIS